VIEIEAVGKTFRSARGETVALSDVSLRISPREVFGVIGPSGAGKSTLIRLINCLERPDTGRVVVGGDTVSALDPAALRAYRRRVGMIFQHFGLLSSRTAAGNVAYPLELAGGLTRSEIRARVKEALDRVGLADQARKFPAQLSGGQKQRVGVARALVTRPDILLCDEATSALDPESTRSLLELIAQLNRELGLTVVLITHEMDVVRRVCDRVAVLDAGKVVETGAVADVFLQPQHPVTQQLVREADPQDPAENLAAVAAGQRVVRLTYRGQTVGDPILAQVARETGVDFSILSGRVSRIKDMPYGQLTVAMAGGDIDLAIRRFEAAQIIVEAA
jgi:D-methionine transport system ATP-binding protein